MGLFSSKSKSSSKTTTTYTDKSTDINNAASLGAAAMNNTVVGAGGSYIYNEQGLTGDNLKTVLGTAENLYNKNESILSQTFNKAVDSVQSSAAKAIDTTAAAYAESDNELRNTIDGLRPIAMYAMFAAIAYFIFRNKR